MQIQKVPLTKGCGVQKHLTVKKVCRPKVFLILYKYTDIQIQIEDNIPIQIQIQKHVEKGVSSKSVIDNIQIYRYTNTNGREYTNTN